MSKKRSQVVKMGHRVFDARPDRVDFRDLPYRPPLASLPPQYPTDAQIERWLPRYVAAELILDQGTEGACTGFGLACVVNYLLWIREAALPGDEASDEPELASVSPRMLYELARQYDEWPGEDYEGSSCRGALKGWHKHGVCRDDLWPYWIDGESKFAPPEPGWETDALGRTLGVYYRVDRASVVDLQAAIVNIGAVYVSAQVHSGWDDLLGNRRRAAPKRIEDVPDIPEPGRSGKLGGHAFALVGFDAAGFIVQNSWGPRWGAAGFGRLRYADWVAHGTDAWACALGVPVDPSRADERATRWRTPSRSGVSVLATGRTAGGRATAGPVDDPWPVDHQFSFKPYEPLSTGAAYQQTLVTGNDGVLCVRDVTKGGASASGDHAREIVHDLPLAWLRQQPTGPVKLAVYAHGGLNDEDTSVQRIRVLAPYFLANDIYPLFLTWRTGAGETLLSMIGDWVPKIPGFRDERQTGFGDWLRDQADRSIETIGRPFGRGVWGEMRENAERGMRDGHGLDLVVDNLSQLAAALAAEDRSLELHLVGHSAGAILLGHLLERMLGQGVAELEVASCALFAPACSVRFANKRYLAAAADGLLPLDRLWLSCLDDTNEKRDGLPSPAADLYGKSLLYLVSRALDDVRKIPLLGMARAHEPRYSRDRDQWAADHLPDVRAWQRAWRQSDGHLERSTIVTSPTVRHTRAQGRIQATHGSFDNNIDILTATLERIRGRELKAELEWLDY